MEVLPLSSASHLGIACKANLDAHVIILSTLFGLHPTKINCTAMKAIWKDKMLAQSDETIVIENNHYFPLDSLNREFFEPSNTTSTCPWKGTASYYHIRIGEDMNRDAAWTYVNPKEAAKEIAGHVAFWKGVEVTG